MNRLGQQTGSDSNAKEAMELVRMIEPHFEQLSSNEQRFISKVSELLDRYGERTIISGKQLFWMRDIKDRLL